MTHPSPDPEDQRLITFLQTYQPPVPPLPPEQAQPLEAKLMAAISQASLAPKHVPKPSVPVSPPQGRIPHRQNLVRVVMLGIMGMGIVGIGQWLSPKPPTMQQIAHLEQFLESSWETSDSHDDIDLWPGGP